MTDGLGDDPRWAHIFGQVREGAELRERGTGGHFSAEARISAFRNGVPPERVQDLTVGQPAIVERLRTAIRDAVAGRPRSPIKLVGASGNGRSHLLRLAGEFATVEGAAIVPTEDIAWTRSALIAQRLFLESIRIRGESLVDRLESAMSVPSIGRDRLAADRLIKELDPKGMHALGSFARAVRAGDHAEAVSLLSWFRGEAVESAWRRQLGLSAQSTLSTDWRGVTVVCLALARILGASALIVTVDDRIGDDLQDIRGLDRHGLLVIAAGAVGLPDSYPIAPLGPQERMDLALRLRDEHLAAYAWPDPAGLTRNLIESWSGEPDLTTTRSFVTRLVSHLDLELARQGG